MVCFWQCDTPGRLAGGFVTGVGDECLGLGMVAAGVAMARACTQGAVVDGWIWHADRLCVVKVAVFCSHMAPR
jgi:hypothetical protein